MEGNEDLQKETIGRAKKNIPLLKLEEYHPKIFSSLICLAFKKRDQSELERQKEREIEKEKKKEKKKETPWGERERGEKDKEKEKIYLPFKNNKDVANEMMVKIYEYENEGIMKSLEELKILNECVEEAIMWYPKVNIKGMMGEQIVNGCILGVMKKLELYQNWYQPF